MQTPEDIQKILSVQTEILDTALENFFTTTPALPLYDHLAYFMGFRDEALKPAKIYGGKRFRSGLMLLLGEYYGARDIVLPYALALELYHNFTLIHDDVVDRDTHRRGRPTVWQLFGTDNAINDGDAQLLLVSELLAKAAHESGSANGVAAQRYVLQQFRTVVEGQYLDFELTKAKLGDKGINKSSYLEMVRCKTAELIVAAAEGTGIITEQPEAECAELARYARSLGIAYQICDDVVSIWATSEATGKRSYGDIKERKKTLPVLHAHHTLPEPQRARLVALYADDVEMSDETCEEIIALLDEVDTKSAMERVIAEHATNAKAAAQSLSLVESHQETLCVLVDSLLPKV